MRNLLLSILLVFIAIGSVLYLPEQKKEEALSLSQCFTEPKSVSHYLSVIEEGQHLNAFTYIDKDGAVAKEKEKTGGALNGVVFAAKDNIHIAGMINSAGTKALRNFVPQKSSSVVAGLEAAGAIAIGKTGLHELAYGITSNNFAFGAIRNPVDERKIPGGSSGGSAVAVKAGMACFALGTDTGGSVRIPAALTGIVGFRPTIGRYAQDGVTLISPTRDTIGFMAQKIDDIIYLDGIVTGDSKIEDIELGKIRVGVPRAHFYSGLDEEVMRAADAFTEKLRTKGITIIEADIENIAAANGKAGFPIVLFETGKVMPEYLKTFQTEVTPEELLANIQSPDVQPIMAAALSEAISEDVYHDALNIHRPALQALFTDYFYNHQIDVILYPTVPIVARNIEGILDGVIVNGEKKDTFTTYIQNTDPASNAGLPAFSLPIAKSRENLPIGMEFVGQTGKDRFLLSILHHIMN